MIDPQTAAATKAAAEHLQKILDSPAGQALKQAVDNDFAGLPEEAASMMRKTAVTLGLIKPPPAPALGSVKLAHVAPQVAHDTREFQRLTEGCATKSLAQALIWGPAVSATEMKDKLAELQKRSENLEHSLQAVAPNDLGANPAETTRKLTEWRDAAEALSNEVKEVYGDNHPLHRSAKAAYTDVNAAATRAFVQLAHNKLGDEGLNEAASSVLGDAPPAAQQLAAHFAPRRAPESPR